MANVFDGLSLLYCGGYAVAAIIGLGIFAVWIWSLWMILTAKNENNWRILWAVVVLLLGIIGTIIYYFIGHKERQA
ncbi:hypothetical protein COT30_01920 [Candidatus Micrarchaeota archaeon CG08_land_8_20_14_0_20_49_17]|nr:MAG: hypothetical protein AUJ13_00610 [Candidatus Micrarchaeota archaeon CG1_02_49_24]PIU09926.1 MAG: hypothetical protein COT30_01920 [Candidatus Micrarchaeota archaeon CG08_land_8_20_14_0_20_49_17]PIU81311.1 MAG: hypothetical protein COS70_04765 [Candidatus Micrarchaeota archaeon CG06_land_8_20_14_3_00_50_6]PIZ93810.1 MAG: hypothetical protein COX84_05700 [Candidatus Micrarchaeota archaeon CG_4_10_14_0_2_um_filter_49_7]HII53446.1 PLDc_N domain-containing protein [Candidatus Micrarchaeota a